MPLPSGLAEVVIDMLWSLWSEFGVAGVVPRRHGEQFIDPEALILFTAIHGDLDRRLRDESIDWVIRYGAHLSKARLKNLRSEWRVSDDEAFARYAATVNQHAALGWPGAARPYPFHTRSRSLLEDLARPSLISLRARAVFGVGARAELMRAFVAHEQFAPAATLSDVTSYGKRNVLNALEALRFAGLVETLRVGNADLFRLARRTEVLALIGPTPSSFPPWNHLFVAILRLLRLMRSAGRSDLENALAAHQFVKAERDSFREAGLYLPGLPPGRGAWPALVAWSDQTLRSIARSDA